MRRESLASTAAAGSKDGHPKLQPAGRGPSDDPARAAPQNPRACVRPADPFAGLTGTDRLSLLSGPPDRDLCPRFRLVPRQHPLAPT